MFKSQAENTLGKNLAAHNSFVCCRKGRGKVLNDRDLRWFLCHVSNGSISYSTLPKHFSYFTPVLANCQAAVNKDGHVSEKKHSFLASLLLHGITPVRTTKTIPTFW